MVSDVFDANEACAYLKIAKVTLYKYVRKGEIPGYKMGKVWRFHRHSLDNWIQNRVQEETASRSTRSLEEIKSLK